MLPIQQHLDHICTTLQHHNSLVLQAEPGAGKSTAVPIALLKANFLKGKKIIMLEPRRVAVKSLAFYLSKLLGESVGQTVGYKVRNDSMVSANTQLEIVTEGILTRKIQHYPELADVGLIIFDEFHERSIHSDLSLMLALEVQEAYRMDLKLLVMSATINVNQISTYLNGAPTLYCEGRSYPVATKYLDKTKRHLPDQVITTIKQVLLNKCSGDILVFLPGVSDIRKCIDKAQMQLSGNILCLPLYGAQPLHEQERVLNGNKSTQTRIIFATNIAETSLTIHGITLVIDSGLEKSTEYDVKSGLSSLTTHYISKASATQRAGRAGRLQAGTCIRLYSESEYNRFLEYQKEEIVNTDLTSVVLELANWGIISYEHANWLSPPPKQHFSAAVTLNKLLGLLDSTNKISQKGVQTLNLGVEPRLGNMMLSCVSDQDKKLACIISALLSERDILVQQESCDLQIRILSLLDLFEQNGVENASNKINKNSYQQVKILIKSFSKALRTSTGSTSIDTDFVQKQTGILLLRAFPDRLAKKRVSSTKYTLSNGRGVKLYEQDQLVKEEWLIVCDCDGKNRDGVIYSCSPISLDSIKKELKSTFTKDVNYYLDDKQEKILGRVQTKYQSLLIDEQKITTIPDDAFNQCIKNILQIHGLAFLNWTKKCQNWLARVHWLGHVLKDFRQINEQHLLQSLDTWLLPYITDVTSIRQLKQVNIFNLMVANLNYQEQLLLEKEAPEKYTTPSNRDVEILYSKHQDPTVSVILQEMFGELTSVLLAKGKVPLRFELLSPARRPIQVTNDLENFWKTSYFEVAKEMRGRYVKHRWPEEPMKEKPGRSIKQKRSQ